MHLKSDIPPNHPHKAAIEARLRRLLTALGQGWRLSVLVEDGHQWGVCLGRTQGERVTRLWSTALAPEEQHPAAFEEWLRSLARRLQDEMDLEVGLRPALALTPHLRTELRRLVERHHGGSTSDGYIVVPRAKRPAFLDEADALGVALEIALWRMGGRTVHAMTRLRHSTW